MSSKALTVETTTIPDPTEAVFYAWAVEWESGGFHLAPVTSIAGADPETAAETYDPRKRDDTTRAVLVRIVVPRSEMRRR